MKNFLILVFFTLYTSVGYASFVGIVDSSEKNRFLGTDIQHCSMQEDCRDDTKVSSSLYVDTFQKIDGYFGINFLKPEHEHTVIYLYNDFMYWLGQKQKAVKNRMMVMNEDASEFQKDADFTKKWKGLGIYQIIVSASPIITNLLASDMPCPQGHKKVAAILAWCDGTDMAPVSGHCVCLQETDAFEIKIEGKQTRPSKPLGKTKIFDQLSTQGSVNFQVDVGTSPQQVTIIKK